MRAIIAGLCIALTAGVAHGTGAADSTDTARAGNIELVKAARWFTEFDSLCTLEGGKLWGASFRGPLMIVDPESRRVVANRADSGGALVRRGGVFVGELPPNMPVANTAVEWLGTRWTMIMLGSLSENPRPRLRLMVHESFHRMQPQLGLESPGELSDHLDSADGRFWLQMEWNALQRALLAKGDARHAAIEDALAFRAARRARHPRAAEREVPLEIHEGLAEYSGFRVVGYADSIVVRALSARRAEETGFVRSFAYVSGPLYGTLLDAASADWRAKVTPRTDLGDLLDAAVFRNSRPASSPAGGRVADAERRARAYGGDSLRAAENAREERRQVQLAAWRKSLIEGPVLIVDLTQVESGSFDPGKVFPMSETQVVYTVRMLVAEWGVLAVAEGAILEDRGNQEGRVSLAGVSADHSTGRDWKLTLAAGWRVAPGERSGDLRLVKR